MRKQAIGKEEANGRQCLGPPRLSNDDELAVEATQASVGYGKPAARPPNAALPDACGPDESGSDDSAHEAHLLGALDRPVYRSSNAAAIFSWGKVQLISEECDPERQDGEEEGVVALAGSQLQKLRAQRGLEDEEIQVDHGRRAGRVMQRIARLARAQRREGARTDFGVCAGVCAGIAGVDGGCGRGRGSALNDGVEIVGHGVAGSRRQRLEAQQARGSGGGES